MYWFYLIIFVLAVLVPDMIRHDMFGISRNQVEELAIFLLGMLSFLFFIFKEHQLFIQKKEKEKDQRRLNQTAKDLVESYSYIGEINRKMDMLMQIGLGLSERPSISKSKEKEIYQSIIDAAGFLLKAKCSTLRFVNVNNRRTIKEIDPQEICSGYRNSDLLKIGDSINIKRVKDFIIVSSHKTIDGVKSFLIMNSFDEQQGKDNNNQEILKYLASQALFLFAYTGKASEQSNKIDRK